MKFLQPPGWASRQGLCQRRCRRGTQIFVGGQIGWNGQQQFETDDFIAQTAQTLRNIVAVLHEAGAGPEHMVRMTWYILDRVEYNARLKELGQVYPAHYVTTIFKFHCLLNGESGRNRRPSISK
jgi:enamine deaminase RidA (YjgF/YER057c/UK114 family)